MKSKIGIHIIVGILAISFSRSLCAQTVTLSGFLKDASSGETYAGANISVQPQNISTQTNRYGFYSLTIDSEDGISDVYVSLNGFISQTFKWNTQSDTMIKVELQPNAVEQIEQVEIISKKNTIADKVEMSKIDLPVNQIKEIPAFLGEKDVLKVIQLMPGVQTASEGQSGLYVRGGGPDQNLLLLDEAIVYNASHLFGFFSVFNGDALKSVELTKGGFPARYGGRLSSVVDLSMKEGNKDHMTGELGIGLLSSRFTLEGPIKKGKSSFMVSGRRTYLDILAQPLIYMASDGSNLGYYFYDFNAKANYELSDQDKFFLSGYFGKDNFYTIIRETFAGETSRLETDFGWGNRTISARWNHLFNPKLFSNLSLIYSHYNLNIGMESYSNSDTFLLNYQSVIDDYGFKYDFDWRPHRNHLIRYGVSSIWHQFRPGALVIELGKDFSLDRAIQTINTYESGAYIEDEWKWKKFTFAPGFRVSHYAVGTKQYLNPEPRFSSSYNYSKDLAFKASYARMNQYIHLLSNAGISLPTDLWIPATENIAPMRSEQVAVGVAKDMKGGYSISIEGYYKDMKNMIQYKDGASFLLQDDLFDPQASTGNRTWENQVTAGQGWSYGTELFVQKKVGKFTGWAGYTLSWTQLKFPELNRGKVFSAKYDRRHDISLVGIYKFSKSLTFSGTWVYGTGNAVTIAQGYIDGSSHQLSSFPIVWDPTLQGQFSGAYIDYGSRNDFRMESYHRLDLGVQFHKEKEKGTAIWEISVYNAYNRANPFFYYGTYQYNSNTNKEYVGLSKIALFPLIPSVSYTFKFK